MSDLLAHEPGATPLSPDDLKGLIPTYITTRAQLNTAEQQNILDAIAWTSRRRPIHEILTEDFVFALHEKMFSQVWRWAGDVRQANTNIGVDYWTIRAELRNLLEDARTWITNEVYPPDEMAVRLKHRMVRIHPFRNGNGRHSRMMADIAIKALGGEYFSWGGRNLVEPSEARESYMRALYTADAHDVRPLLLFSRS